MPSQLSHLDAAGNLQMVDVSAKPATARRASAMAEVRFSPELFADLHAQNFNSAKGAIFQCARIAAIMAAKNTAAAIPLCHPLPLSHIAVEFFPDASQNLVSIRTEVATTATTGVEMEALHAASIAALTIYDMCKARDKSISICQLRLLAKHGGKSTDFQADI